MRLLGEVNKRITERKGEKRKDHEEEISKEKVKVAFKKIKEGKATGIDGLIDRVRDVFRETKSRVKVRGELGENFWTARGVRQGCPLSPMLFNILIADLEERIGRVKWGGIEVERRRIYSLAYADDIVLLAEDEEGMKSMIGRLEEYIDEKRLELNVE